MITNNIVQSVPFVDLGAQLEPLADQIFEVMEDVVNRSAFILGPEVTQFEQNFADYCETKYAVGVDSGTSALELILRAYNIGPGDEVITAANTFIATVLAITHTGAKPVLVDIDPNTYNIDIFEMDKAINERTRAVIPVHLYGHPADMDPILKLAESNNLIVVEDACQAHGARYNGTRVGGIGHAAAFSFYPAKNLGAFGDAGMVVTNDVRVCETIRMLRDQGQRSKYHHEIKGHNHRLDNIQAAILDIKLNQLDNWNAARRRNAARYNQLLSGSGVIIPHTAPYAEPVYHLYVIRVDARDELIAHLAEKGIATGIHYPIPIHFQPAYKDLGYHRGDLPTTEQYAKQILSLPMYPDMEAGVIEYVAYLINEFLYRRGNN